MAGNARQNSHFNLVISNYAIAADSTSWLITDTDNPRNSLVFKAVHETVLDLSAIINQPESINLSLSELRLLMSKAGYAFIGFGCSRHEPPDAVMNALKTPLLDKYSGHVNDYLALIKVAGGYSSFGYSSSSIQEALSHISKSFVNLKPGSYSFIKMDTAQSPDRHFQILLLAFGNREMKITDVARLNVRNGIVTYLHKFRCKNCKLHFIVCSWYEWITPVYCPECGNRADNWHWIQKVDQPIREIVPGSEPPTEWINENILEK